MPSWLRTGFRQIRRQPVRMWTAVGLIFDRRQDIALLNISEIIIFLLDNIDQTELSSCSSYELIIVLISEKIIIIYWQKISAMTCRHLSILNVLRRSLGSRCFSLTISVRTHPLVIFGSCRSKAATSIERTSF